jgi:hypothetical protein
MRFEALSGPLWFAVGMLLVSNIPAGAQTSVGGHIGFVLPLVTHAGGNTTNIADSFSIGFPLGITFKGQGRMAYSTLWNGILSLPTARAGSLLQRRRTRRRAPVLRHLLIGVCQPDQSGFGPFSAKERYTRWEFISNESHGNGDSGKPGTGR